MRVTALITEYNPLHRGHEYHMQEARRLTGADYLLVVMSGDFVQRGEPAVTDKFTRTQTALACGADAVIELPVRFACGSAEYFASGAVSLLDALGCVDFVCFGSESGDLGMILSIANVLATEPPVYRERLRLCLKKGLSYPKARAKALFSVLAPSLTFSEEQFSDFLALPNHILGIEYCKALRQLHSHIQPVTVKRAGSGYHDTFLSETYCSATALRALLSDSTHDLSGALAHLPAQAVPAFTSAYGHTLPLFANDFSSLLHYRLLTAKDWQEFAVCFDVSETLARRIFRMRYEYTNFEEFALRVKPANLTLAHVRRALLHILLQLPASCEDESSRRACYARLLGFRTTAAPLLREIKNSGHLPLVSKLADARSVFSSFEVFSEADTKNASLLLDTDILASEIYAAAAAARFGTPAVSEYTKSPIVLQETANS